MKYDVDEKNMKSGDVGYDFEEHLYVVSKESNKVLSFDSSSNFIYFTTNIRISEKMLFVPAHRKASK